MGNIVLLDELTINKIAAGEVIERPASVVKELVENSIDAGAKMITVEIQNGGIKRIKIIDDGCGISKDDMAFAFERHATSKIRNANDLENVKSMGFRGEALASIAAIANVKMISRVPEDSSGNIIVVEGGKILEHEEIAAGVGTTITVTNLFYNTPVRYKFLKKDFTEAGYIEDVVTRIALSHPNIAIKLINGNKTIIQTNGSGKIKDVIYSIYGKNVAEEIIEVSYNYEDIKVEGVVGKPEIARNNRSYQQFFVNKRYIKDKTLTSAADQAFKGLVTIGKYGFLVLNVEIDPVKIDVNVHPSKLEVRWQEEQKVFKAVYHTIREGLLKGELVRNNKKQEMTNKELKTLIEQANKLQTIEDTNVLPKINEETNTLPNNVEDKFKTQVMKTPSFIDMFKKKEDDDEEFDFIERNSENAIQDIYNKQNGIEQDEGKDEDKNEDKDEYKGEYEDETEDKDDENSKLYKIPTEEQIDKIASILNLQKNTEEKTEEKTNEKIEGETEESKIEEKHNFDLMYEKTFGKSIIDNKDKKEEDKIPRADLSSAKNISVFEENEEYKKIPAYKFIGALFSTYIVIEIGDEIYIIDQHAAHERVMYEKVKKNFYNETNKDSQIMLLPDIINLTHKEKDIVKENAELFKKAGFILEEFGENTIRLIGVPSLCMDLDTKKLFLQILDEIDTVAITATQEKEEKFISTIACKAAVKANMKLDKEEVDNLMSKLLVLKNPFTCPHGRPTAIKMTRQELDRKFERT